MSRPSTMYADQPHPTRSSLFPGAAGSHSHSSSSSSAGAGGGASTSRLQAKQQELEGLKELREYSARLVRELETMGQGLEAIKKGEESVAQVMSSWQTVFRGIQVAQASIIEKSQTPGGLGGAAAGSVEAEAADAAASGGVGGGAGGAAASLVPDTLVRIPLDPGLDAEGGSAGVGVAVGGREEE